MKVVTRTGEYTIYRKRNQRCAVRNKDRQWVRGDDKVAILLAHDLVVAPAPKAPDHPEEPDAQAPGEAAAGAAAESAGEGDGEQAEGESEADKS